MALVAEVPLPVGPTEGALTVDPADVVLVVVDPAEVPLPDSTWAPLPQPARPRDTRRAPMIARQGVVHTVVFKLGISAISFGSTRRGRNSIQLQVRLFESLA